MDQVFDALAAIWPIFAGLAIIVYSLIKLHVDVENVKQKITVLFDLWNSKDKN
jgi:hypothetical protein|tara:strand:- start:201 stop:359 length:159 start_codon:yes stop_codon:yes gene_type:complete